MASKTMIDEEQESGMTRMNGGGIQIESVDTKAGKRLLNGMDIDFPAGCVTGILGPSGSGKTTLINTLTNNVPSNVVAKASVHMPGATAFVPQDDRLHGFYTCRGYLKHYARLSGINPSSPAVQDEIETLLDSMGLKEQANTIVGDIFIKGLSGGQKRRLSIALEALTTPKNFFLDEPTSGLDAESAYQVMEFLKTYVRAAPGRRVILTIHQPSSFIWSLLDNAVLLSKGRLMYQGPRVHMERFFSFAGYPTPPNYNPADHYVTVVNDEFRLHEMTVLEWADKFAEYKDSGAAEEFMEEGPLTEGQKHRSSSILAIQKAKDVETRRSRSILVAFELTYRYFLNLWFNPGILGTRIAMYTMLGGMVGALFWDLGERFDLESINSRAAVLFYCVAFFIFMSVAVLPFTVIERAIVDKEVRNGYYHPAVYQLAQAISSIPGTALLSFVTTLLIITMTKMNAPFWYFLDMFLSLLCAEALAQLVSHVVPHFIIGMALIAGLYGFFMLFQGFMIIPSDFPVWLRWTNSVAFHTYSWRTFMYNEFEPIESFDTPIYATGMDVLAAFDIDDVNRTNDMIVLAGYAMVLHLISFIVLHLKYNLFHGKVIAPKNGETDQIASSSRPGKLQAPTGSEYDC